MVVFVALKRADWFCIGEGKVFSWASQMEKKVGKEEATKQEQEQLDWALDQLPHHRTKR